MTPITCRRFEFSLTTLAHMAQVWRVQAWTQTAGKMTANLPIYT